ncbi:hypothetical protein QU481_03870 [Crenobacter sp. SG2303]|uniref:Phasin domain-containing protein n=1 Tax=Crenobacter oryzisoli TaxID=3056844 RepID=A0ABT7XJQ8_9NEIS|nr:hypothetical protein [Crenobacter sp. SG2303]MDN0074026.1 hypothetical protein [Crenobacter sp. SG2303]
MTAWQLHGIGGLRLSNEAVSPGDHAKALKGRTDQIQAGDLGYAETVLAAQAQTLDALFNLMAQRAVQNVGHSLEATERYMRMAMKAQSQCRATLETLAEVKHPRVAVFANQANVTSGPQQVNNGTAPHAPGSTAPQANRTNELLEHQHGEWMDTRAPGQAGRGDQAVEAVGEEHRAEDGRRQGGQ